MKTNKKTMKRVMSILLSATMLLSSVQSVFAVTVESFTDFPTGWSRPAMEAAVDNGLLVGVGGNEIKPTANLSRAEMAAIMVRAFGAVTTADISRFTDIRYDSWYYEYIAKAVQMGAMAGKSTTEMCPECDITREEAFAVIARILALSDSDTSSLSKFNDGGDVSGWAAENLAALVKRGYVNGDNLGNLNPKANITREEFAQVMYTTIKTYITEGGTYSDAMEGIVVLRVGNVALNGAAINGDLVVGDGAMNTSVKLTGVAVDGRFLTRGGIMTLKNTTVSQGVVVLNPNGITRFNNYRTEPVYAGIIEHTVASFLTGNSIGGSGGSTSGTTKYYVTFEVDGDEYEKIKVTKGKEIGKDMPKDPEKVGYKFDGWFDEDGNEVTKDTKIKEKLTVTAKFSVTDYDIYYKNEDGSAFSYFVDGYLPENKFNIEEPYELPGADKVYRKGYKFNGWKDADGNPVTEIKVTEDTPEDGLAIYPDFELIEYNITYKDENGNAFTEFIDGYTPEATFNAGDVYELPGADKVYRKGYKFNGWVDAGGYPVTKVEVTEGTPDAGLELYPDFELIEYKLIFEAEFKDGDSQKEVIYTVENYASVVFPGEDELVIPDGKEALIGWFNDNGVQVDALDESYIKDEPTTTVLKPDFTDAAVTPTPSPTPDAEFIEVKFYRGYGEDGYISGVSLELNDDGFAQVPVDDIPKDTPNPTLLKKKDYVMNNYPDYNGVYKVAPTFWYEKDSKLVPFDTTVKLTEDTKVYLLNKEFAINVSLEGFSKSVTLASKYNDETRLMDSVKLMGDSAVNWLGYAKAEPKYNKLIGVGTDLLVSKNIMDANRNLKMLYLPAKISLFTDKATADRMVRDKFRLMVKEEASLVELLDIADIDALIADLGVESYVAGLSDAETLDFIKVHILGLSSDGKRAAADGIYAVLSSKAAYKKLIDDLFKKNEISVIPEDLSYVKALSHAISELSVDEALSFTTNSGIEKLINFVGKDFVSDRFIETRDDYCAGLDKAIEDVENGVASSKKYTTSLRFRVNPVEDVLVRLYDKAQPIVENKLINAGVYYDENEYLQYIVEHDVVLRLVEGDGVVNGEFIGYKLKDEVDYAKYIMELLIATDDALCWYGDDANLTDAQVEAIIDASFAKVQYVHAKLNALLEDYSTTGELPGGLNELIAKVEQINNIFVKLEPKLKSIIDKYLAHSINDKIQDGSLIENEKVLTAIDIMLGQEDPTFTIDSLYDIFWQYDDKMQAKLKALVDSGKLESAIDKAFAKIEATGKVPEGLDMDKIEKLADDFYAELVNIAENGIEDYKVNTSDVTIIDKYEMSIGGNVFSVMRAYK